MESSAEAVLENEFLRVRIAAKGAEMQSIEQACGEGWLERLWCADPAVWGRHAPLLFPLIGRLRDGYYELDGERICAPVHGFCRDRAFNVEQASPIRARFATSFDDETLAVYPFAFKLAVEYELRGNTLVKSHVVENVGERPMPFEVGGHEAYAVRQFAGERMADYYVEFEGADAIEAFGMDEQGILTLPKQEITLDGGKLAKTPEELGLDTIVLENVPGSRVALRSARNEHEVVVEFPDFPYLGIWTAQGKGEPRYLCIEPWSALPDGHFAAREFARKPGVRVLAPGEVAKLAYSMTFR